jgi:putative transposase
LFEEIRQALAKGETQAVKALCAMTGLSRATYYRRRMPQFGIPVQQMELRDEIQRIALEFPCYGYRRITAELRRRNWDVNHKPVLRLMREDNLLCLRRKPFVPRTTDSRHRWPTYPNLGREMKLTALNQLWVADITYIRLRMEFAYLAVILDAYSRRVIGWALGRGLDAELTLSALRMALRERKPAPGLVHHSDRGVQYACSAYTDLLKQHGATISMSRTGNPYDKAYVAYCTSCEPWTMFSGKRRRSASLTPCALRGGSGPGSSYRQMFLSFTG